MASEVPDEIMELIPDDRRGEFTEVWDRTMERMAPHVPAASTRTGPRIVRDDAPRPSNREVFGDWVRRRTRGW